MMTPLYPLSLEFQTVVPAHGVGGNTRPVMGHIFSLFSLNRSGRRGSPST
ncbi:hypothetical protein [Nitrosomonas communis]|nr:hypothetical protein [Nitrosomonas communis]MCO6427534.1 hypothetical protein [Nitrosomonas communis]